VAERATMGQDASGTDDNSSDGQGKAGDIASSTTEPHADQEDVTSRDVVANDNAEELANAYEAF